MSSFLSATDYESKQSELSKNSNILKRVRKMMSEKSLDAIIGIYFIIFLLNWNVEILVPTEDPHMSEYTSPYFARREFVSSFTGSAGTALLTKEESLLFTDGRWEILCLSWF